MDINTLCKAAHDNAVEHGFYNDAANIDPHLLFAKTIALIHSELSEALEADRKNKHAKVTLYHSILETQQGDKDAQRHWFELLIKDTVEDELADAVIRIFDYCGYAGIDLEAHIVEKMNYNKLRPKQHGKEY